MSFFSPTNYLLFHQALQGVRVLINGEAEDKVTLYHYLPTAMINRIIASKGYALNTPSLPDSVSFQAKDKENWGQP